MLIGRSRPTLMLAGALLAVFAATESGAQSADARASASCDGTAAAAEYDRKADDYAAAAERYRTWASAEGMFSAGIRGSEWEFRQQAQRMDLAAERTRALAAEARGRENSETCAVEPIAGTKG